MANGLYSGTSGLALGSGLYRDVSGLWGGASGLVSGFGASFSPTALFSAGEQGVWYDPSDLTTLFQDSAGTTPVTSVGQSVGLVLDKHLGLTLGSELVSNGNFSNGSTGWTLGAGWSVSGGQASFSGGTSGGISQSIPSMVAGLTYQVTMTVSGLTGTVGLRFGLSSTTVASISSNGTLTFRVAATSGGTLLFIFASAGATITVDDISAKLLPDNHATQANISQRPVLQQDGSGLYYLLFDGSDDGMLTSTFTPGADKMQLFYGVRKLSDATIGMVIELSTSATITANAFNSGGPASAGAASYGFRTQGSTITTSLTLTPYAAPITNVITGIGDVATDTAIGRVNGVQVASSAADQGSGNFAANPLYIGRRAGANLPFNGRIYSLILRFGSNLDAATIQQAEAWVNSKTGAY